jgi:hypothetical protein
LIFPLDLQQAELVVPSISLSALATPESGVPSQPLLGLHLFLVAD